MTERIQYKQLVKEKYPISTVLQNGSKQDETKIAMHVVHKHAIYSHFHPKF